jgi:arginyl-tRNA synthetase
MEYIKNKYYSAIKSQIQKVIFDSFSVLFPEIKISLFEVEVEIPENKSFGDFSTNIAMKLVKNINQISVEKYSPITLANKIISQIQKSQFIIETTVAMPGFINFKVSGKYYLSNLRNFSIDASERMNLKYTDKKAIVEFGQPNTHKDFTVGHLKSAISGLSIVRLKEALGYKVIKANYYGDIGLHTAKATWSFIKETENDLTKFNKLSLEEKMSFIAECYVKGNNVYKDDEIAKLEIKKLNKDIYLNRDSENVRMYEMLKQVSLEYQTHVWEDLGVVYDIQYPESQVFKNAVNFVEKSHNTKPGEVFEESDGAIVFKGEKYGLNTWVFLTSEGNPTYSAKDLALAKQKFTDYPDLDLSIVTTSIEQADYFKAVIQVIKLVFPEIGNKYLHLPFGWMLKDGKKTSSRLGNAIKGIDVVNEARRLSFEKINDLKGYQEENKKIISKAVADSGLKFFILSHEFHRDINYNFERMISSEGFSGPYILYSYARAKSILNEAKNFEPSFEITNQLNTSFELDLVKQMDSFEDVVYISAITLSPHLVTNYIYELAQKFSAFYLNCPVIKAEEETAKARLLLVSAYSNIIKKGLHLLGIEVIEKM